MLATVLIAANMCLQGGERVDVSRSVDPAASFLELKVTLERTTRTLVVYFPGYEEQQPRFSDPESSALIPFAEPILCVAAIGGPLNSRSKSCLSNLRINPMQICEINAASSLLWQIAGPKASKGAGRS